MRLPLCTLLATLSLVMNAQHAPLSQRVANYDMEVTLDIAKKQLNASTALTWINPSSDTVRELQFHLYYNAFKNTQSTWMQEDDEFMQFLGSKWYDACGWSWSVMHDIQDASGKDLTAASEYIQPDDENVNDQTVFRVPLHVPVMPFDSARFSFNWTAQIPRVMVRTGYNLDFYFFAQWFPKLGVYEPAGMRNATKGGWNCHQFHADGEFYADFGTYRVQLNIPDDWKVAASGTLVDTQASETGLTAWTFLAEDVIDFTWTTSPHFIQVNDTWKDVSISLMVYPEHVPYASRFIEPMKYSLEFMDAHLGDYPYPNITIIGPPLHGSFTGGMEYPTLITSMYTAFLPKGFKSTETLVVHEFIHQYFMQMVATNEQEEPWMDEGITNYYEGRILDGAYGKQTSMWDGWGVSIGNEEFTRHQFFSSGQASIGANASFSWQFPYGGYSMLSYNKVALWLKTLEGLIGTEVFDEAMRTYRQEWKFKHPSRKDFETVFNKVITKHHRDKWPDGMDWFFTQVIDGTEVCDYRVYAIRQREVREPLGFVSDTSACITPSKSMSGKYSAEAILYREGGIHVPVEVRITFEDGKQIMETWDGKGRVKGFAYAGSSKIASVEIDPERKIFMDQNFINNSMTLQRQSTGLSYYFLKYLTTMQQLLENITFLV